MSVLFLKQGNDNQSLEQNMAAYETLKELGIQREFNAMDYTPVIKENPKYPTAAARNGVSGYVILEYAVTKTGAVEDISVIDSKPTGIFDEAAIEAAQKYRYMPRIVDGKPIDVPGVKTRITFEI